MNLVAWLKFKLAYFDVAAQQISHSTTGIPLPIKSTFCQFFDLPLIPDLVLTGEEFL